MARRIVNKNVTNAVYDYLSKTDGTAVTTDRISDDTGISRNSVMNSTSYMIRHKPELGIVRVKLGIYAYRPNAKPVTVASTVPRMFEEVGHYKDGSILVRDVDGQLYALTEL